MDIENMFSDIRIKTKGGKTEVDFEFLGDGRYMAFILALVIKNLDVHKESKAEISAILAESVRVAREMEKIKEEAAIENAEGGLLC